MSNHSEEKKPIYKKWWFWVIIIIIMVVFSLLYNKGTLETNAKNEKSQNTVEYKFYSSVLKNLSKDKIDKIIANKDITNDELENIYKERV